MQFSDKILVILIKQGNTKAFSLFFDRYHRKLYHFSFSILKSKEEAEEVVQEVFARIWEQRDQLDDNISWGAYLYKSTRNASLNILRKKINARYYADFVLNNQNTDDNNLSSGSDHDELNLIYENAIKKIPEKRRQVFLLSREEGLSHKEIAQKLNISLNTVETQIRRALEFLREKLAEFRSGK